MGLGGIQAAGADRLNWKW